MEVAYSEKVTFLLFLLKHMEKIAWENFVIRYQLPTRPGDPRSRSPLQYRYNYWPAYFRHGSGTLE